MSTQEKRVMKVEFSLKQRHARRRRVIVVVVIADLREDGHIPNDAFFNLGIEQGIQAASEVRPLLMSSQQIEVGSLMIRLVLFHPYTKLGWRLLQRQLRWL